MKVEDAVETTLRLGGLLGFVGNAAERSRVPVGSCLRVVLGATSGSIVKIAYIASDHFLILRFGFYFRHRGRFGVVGVCFLRGGRRHELAMKLSVERWSLTYSKS